MSAPVSASRDKGIASPVLTSEDWRTLPPVLVGSIWDEDLVLDAAAYEDVPDEAADSTTEHKGRNHEAIRRQRVNAKRRHAYEQAHFALVGRPAPTVIPFVPAKRVVAPRPPSPSGRVLKNVYVSQVGRFQFRLIHRMEGRWNGETTVMTPGLLPEVRVVSTELKFDAKAGRWNERQSLTDSSGLTSTQMFHYVPTGDSQLAVTSDDPYLTESVDIRLVEHSENVLILTAISHETSKPVIVETVTVIDNLRRVRTVQRFDPAGHFKCLYLVNESRVIDSVSGAVEEFHAAAASPS